MQICKINQEQITALSRIIEKCESLENINLPILLGLMPSEFKSKVRTGLAPRIQAVEMVRKAVDQKVLYKLVDALECLEQGASCVIEARQYLESCLVSSMFSDEQITKLITEMDLKEVSASDIRESLRELTNSPPFRDKSEIASVLRELSLLPPKREGFPFPLIEFVLRLANRNSGKTAKTLWEWAHKAADSLGISETIATLDVQIRHESDCCAPAIMIVLERHVDSPEKFTLEIILWKDDCTPEIRVHPGVALSGPQLEEQVNHELRRIGDKLSQNFIPESIIVEVAVPASLSTVDFDSWRVGITPFPDDPPTRLDENFPTAIRSLDRLKSPLARGKWTKKWTQLVDARASVKASLFDPLSSDLRIELEQRDPAIAGFSSVPTVSAVRAIVNHGLAAAVWPKKLVEIEGSDKVIEEFMNSCSENLPVGLYQRRKIAQMEGKSVEFWRSMSVLWEDPDRRQYLNAKFQAPKGT